MRNQYSACIMTATYGMLLFCLCCLYEIRPAACKPVWMSRQFPCDVTSLNASEVIFDCRGRRLHGVPRGITSNVTDLNLSQNNIKNITAGAFSAMLNLTQLNLNWANKGKKLVIFENAFKNLTRLQKLSLTGNRLENIPGSLPLSLRVLELENNKIVTFENRTVAGLTHVTHLWLSKNCFRENPCGHPLTIKENSFAVMTKLQALNLSFNNLSHVPKGLPQSLTLLDLRSNKIEKIGKDDFFGLQNLAILDLQGNCPRCQNAPFYCVPCQNDSLAIHPDAFQKLANLKRLHLGGNSLSHVKESWFKNLNKLKYLFLSFNFLRNVVTEEAAFLSYLPKLQKLDLSFNFALKSYPVTLNFSKHFANLVSLRTLHLEGLVFQSIGPDTFRPLYELKNLSALNLGTNFILHSDSTVFSKFQHLKMIYLAENRLYPVAVEDPPSPRRYGYNQRSDVSISPLTIPHSKDFAFEISHRFVKEECFDSGQVLSLSSNNLFFISPKQFEGYGDIACLNLSRNGFSAALNGTEFSSLPNLTYLDLSFNKIDLAYDNAFKELKKLQVLDLSYNAHYFQAYGVTHNLHFTRNLPVLRVLNMSNNLIFTLTTKQIYSQSLAELQFAHNNLGKLWEDNSYEHLFTNLTNLTILDISYNKLQDISEVVYKNLPHNLTILRISHNSLTDFNWEQLKWFRQLQILDLSHNALSVVTVIDPNVAQTLTFLDLSNNNIFQLDSGFTNGQKNLETLSLSNNKLNIINQSTFQLGPENHIKNLFLQGNPFQCTCDSLDFILWIEKSDVNIPWLITEVTCDTPRNQKNQALIMFDLQQCVNTNLAFLMYIFSTSFILAFMCVATVAHLFYWDASYVLHYMKAKLKGYELLNSPDSVYGAFVTYDTRDPQVSEWVMRNLRVQLEEKGEKHLPLCLEERDWPPGVPLVDNLTQSIQYSRKTLFVLTEGYVKTGVFKLAMYLAHQRLLDENVDVIVLLMLEPVLQHSHFLRLRRRLCGNSVVEWPRTAAAEPWFWQNLRNIVRVDNQVMYNKTYSRYFTSK
ncbi:toll-like receptor 8 [Mugil cephalus]|uniref:toll-like receptor 8 n=1 Tax=Mugil cephalus TaxID=48193 RepID=UPI001FB5E4E6|nr:toll-like receptor 8 [Mugil cephalus]